MYHHNRLYNALSEAGIRPVLALDVITQSAVITSSTSPKPTSINLDISANQESKIISNMPIYAQRDSRSEDPCHPCYG